MSWNIPIHIHHNHNKLRTYKTYKSSFTREPYIDLVRNRNQKSSLTRLRTGSHFLGVEKGRWSRPVTPLEQRTCSYCSPPNRFDTERIIAFEEISSLVPNFSNMSEQQKFKIFLCPTQPQTAKSANRFIKKMFDLREKIDQSENCVNVAMPND